MPKGLHQSLPSLLDFGRLYYYLLPSSVPAVDAQVGAGHEAAGVGEQEDGGAAVVLGLAQLVEHVLLGPLDGAVGEPLEQPLHHLRHDVPRRDRVHPDVLNPPLRR